MVGLRSYILHTVEWYKNEGQMTLQSSAISRGSTRLEERTQFEPDGAVFCGDDSQDGNNEKNATNDRNCDNPPAIAFGGIKFKNDIQIGL